MPPVANMARSDLLDYLRRYRDTPRRRVARVERWRRREADRGRIATAAKTIAGELHAAGLGEGARVGLWIKDGPLWAAGLFGALRIGAVAVPIDTAHPPERAARLAERVGIHGWIADEELPRVDLPVPCFEVCWQTLSDADVPPVRRTNGYAEIAGRPTPSSLAHPPPDRPADVASRPAQLVLTSGTSNEPQSVELSHANLRTVLDRLEREIDAYKWLIRLGPRLRIAVALPLSHLYGQYMGVLLPVLLDADVALLDNLAAGDLADAVRGERAWALATVPHTLAALLRVLISEGHATWGKAGFEERLHRAESLSGPRRVLLFDRVRRRLGRRLVAVVSGGASLDEEVERLWRALGYVVIQGYGLTEAAPLVTLNHPFHARGGSVGRPLAGVELRVGDQGEILVRGPNVATPSAAGPRVDEEGWLHTGDLGEVLDDGSIRFLGRRSERIVTPAGVNIDAAGVNAALRARPEIIDAFVLEQPWGEPGTVCAVLVAYPGADVDAAVRRANRDLEDAARVRSWYQWPGGDLPRTSTGKVRRQPVLEWLAGKAPDGVEEAAKSMTKASTGPPTDRVDLVLTALGREESARGVSEDAVLGELLSSLERVELATRIEELYGLALDNQLFVGDPTVGDLAAALRRATGGSASGDPRDQAVGAAPPVAVAPLPGPRRHESSRPAGVDPASWRHWPVTRAVRFVVREGVMHPLARSIVRLEVDSEVPLEVLPEPFLLAANHTSYIDPVVMFALPPRMRARLAPAGRWNFFTGHPRGRLLYFWTVLGLDLIPLVQSGDWRPTLRIGGDLADRGHSILIYPEGEISRDGQVHEFRPGVGLMARELHLPVVPCATAGFGRIVPPGTRRVRRPGWSRPTAAVCIGKPLPAPRPGSALDPYVDRLESEVRRLRQRALEQVGRRRVAPTPPDRVR